MSKWIFFDLDGTLVNHSYAFEKACILVFRDILSVESSHRQKITAQWEEVSERWYRRYLEGQISFEAQRRGRLREFVPNLTDDECSEVFALYAEEYDRNICVYPDVAEFLFRIKGHFNTGIITNGDASQQRRKLKKLGLDAFFKIVVISAEEGVAKPHQEIFKRALSRANAVPNKTVFVGDKLDIDAEAAQRAGMTGIWLNRLSLQRSKNVLTIHSLNELLNISMQPTLPYV